MMMARSSSALTFAFTVCHSVRNENDVACGSEGRRDIAVIQRDICQPRQSLGRSRTSERL